MFEGLVRQLLLGYLGQYIKDIHKEQLKITLWNEEVLLENVELILEAFDYLQLPFSLKRGHVGRLSIKIPWKKLGWDPIIIILEDVLLCACQRDDQEWSMDAVERREFAGKKAKLATAELAKLSRRVFDNQTGKSFISYITAKILDGIQVSIRNVHVLYRDKLAHSAQAVIGLKFSSLTVMKQNLIGFSSGKMRGGQVNKLVEVQGLEIYCDTFQGTLDLTSIDNYVGNTRVQGDKHLFMLAPVDLSASILVNRSGKLGNDAPQYSINVELTGLVVSLDEIQLQQILTLSDYLCTYRLREKYGRYRPCLSPLSKRLEGWQTVWWHYAQQSVLSDVRKRLQKTSWKYLGERINCRRKYVKLYKRKLECLRLEQLVNEDILRELEQMERESDIEDILSYRSAAECELREFLVNSSSSNGFNGVNIAVDKSLDDEHPSSKSRGWLNWLSHGMLGAGGTDDSSQFSGVVSDEVIKDIYEATKFHPVPSPNEDIADDDEIYLSSFKFNIHQISATLRSMEFGHAVAELIFEGILVECKIWEESALITASINSVVMLNPLNKQVILLSRKAIAEGNVLENEQPVLNIQVDVSPVNREVELSLKVMLQPLEVTCDSEFILNIREFYNVLESFKFPQQRVLLSLNGIDDVKARLLSKAECILSSRKRVAWDINFTNIIVTVPWKNANLELHNMVLESRALSFASKREMGCFASDMEDQSYVVRNFINSISAGDMFMGFQLQDLYDHFEIKLIDFEMKMLMPYCDRTISLLEKFSSSITLAVCIVPDESIFKGLEVYILVSSLVAHFSPSIYGAILGLIANFDILHLTSDSAIRTMVNSLNIKSNEPSISKVFCFSVIANLESASLLVDLENDTENSCTLLLSLQEFNVRLSLTEFPECWICLKAMRIITCSRKSEEDSHILCSSENSFAAHSAHLHDAGVRIHTPKENCDIKSTFADGCFLLYYESRRNLDLICHKYTVCVNDVDLHCYPYIIGLMVGFSEKIFGYGMSLAVKDSPVVEGKSSLSGPGFDFQRFGFSNFIEPGSSEWASIPLDHFPFVTINNFGSLVNLESALIYAIPEWRKVLNLRERKIRSPKFSVKKGSKKSYGPSLISTVGTDGLPTPRSFDDTDRFFIDLNLSSIRVHFHDSSCIVGTVTLPTSKSSFSIHEDLLDIMCSTEGLTLSSSWWTQTRHDFLWGPSLLNLSPIINMRVRKGNSGSLRSLFEISFSIQHVSCILPPEFLAIIIGYFSLPDWKSNAKEQSVTEKNNIAVTYKFEILDSTLFTPVESGVFDFLKLDIQQFYCSFIHNSDSNIVLKDIPSECLVPADKVADRNHCLNFFGRHLSLSLLLVEDAAFDSLNFNQNIGQRNISLIAPLSADVWIRIPHEWESTCVSSSTCIMARVSNCQLVAEDAHVLVGYEALLAVIDQLFSVPEESRGFTSDVLQFLQFKRSIKENNAVPLESSSVTFTETRCCVQSMSIKFYGSTRESFASELIAKAEMQFICSASLRNDKLLCLDISFSSIALFSLINSVMLAECTSLCSISSVLDLNLSMSDQGENELRLSLPSLDIWLHLFDWSKVIDLFYSYYGQLSETSTVNALTSENIEHDAVSLIVRSENTGITIHIPVRISGEAFSILGEPQFPKERPLNNSSNIVEGNQYGFVVVNLQSRCSELVSDGKTVRLKSNLEKTSGTVELCMHNSVHAWPFFQFLQVNVEAEISNNEMEHAHVKAEVQCDCLDVWLSHHIFYFWRCMVFENPLAGSSQFTLRHMDFQIQLRKLSVLLTDGKWSFSRPLLELLMRNLLLQAKVTEEKMDVSVAGDFQVNYNNIHKVLWEPFVEPWKFQLSITRRLEKSALLNTAVVTDIHLKSTTELNLNLTESLAEVLFRAIDTIRDAWGLNVISEGPNFSETQRSETLYTGRDAPYLIQNLTSLPLVFNVCEGPVSADDLDVSALKDENFVQPGSSIPIYIDETPEEQLFRSRPPHSSDRLSDKQFMEAAHRYIIIQLEGTCRPSTPISMDLVGLSYFEVDFSKSSNNLEVGNIGDDLKSNKNFEGSNKAEANIGYVVPVVIDVSVRRYTKLVRFYSTVILSNATSLPFEVRFDIPFGVSPKILDPIYPGQEFPLPLHLAETGRMRWRPLGNTYLWSEAYGISNIISHENRIGIMRSFVCYPSHPSSDPFRSSISVHDMCLPSIGRLKRGSSLCVSDTVKQSVENCGQLMHNLDRSNKRFIHVVTFRSPLVLKKYIPGAISLTIESGGVTRTALITEVETSFFHIDSSHDLTIAVNMHGFRPSVLKFPRAEAFGSMAKFSGTKFSLCETITFDSDLSEGPLHVTMEKVMDAFSGAREICIFVPFLLYNCTGFSLIVSNSVNEMKGHGCIVPSCYDLIEQDLLGKKDGLGLLSSIQDVHTAPHRLKNSSQNNHIISTRKTVDLHPSNFLSKPLNFPSSLTTFHGSSYRHNLYAKKSSLESLKNKPGSSSQSNLKSLDFEEIDYKKVNACMYSPDPNSSASEIMVRARRCLSECITENIPNCSWSSPFSFVPPTGSTSVLVPQPSTSSAYIVSVTSSAVAGPFSGRTRIITFQPRYIISNACSKDLCYKQKGTDLVFHLRIGQHSHIHWTDTTRELLVSLRFNETGWQWSGCFLPEHLGDTQLKMRNYVSGAENMIRVEVQNADVSIGHEKIVGSPHENSGTNLILLSDDDTGFMPYRIDNFSKERLRIFQQRCETFETVIQSYTSCPYAWDEPCNPHRLTVELPGERIIGSYALDDIKEYTPVCLLATSEKPERKLLVSVHAEGAQKVLNIIDSSYHILNDVKGPRVSRSKEKRIHDWKQETFVQYEERISVAISFIGISVMNSYPQELLFACAKTTTIDLVQNVDQQKFTLQIASLQIDNQLHSTPYPVILSFDHEYKSNPVGQMRTKDDSTEIKSESVVQIASDSSCGPVFSLAAAKWRNKEISLVSFEYISLRVADFHLELEQEVILSLFDFFKTISSSFQSRVFPDTHSTMHPHLSPLLPSVVPIGAPWQQIYLLARKQKKIYVELFDLAPIKLTLSFSSSPWMLRNGVLTSGESLVHRGLMALADVEGAQIHLKQLIISHQLASWESIQEILTRHYTRQLLHEMYKLFGSAGVIGNPMGFARSVGLGIKDFLSVPARSVMQSPAGLITGMAQGTTSLLSNTVYAISDAATQFSRAAHKAIVAFTFDDLAVAKMEKQQKGILHSQGVVNEVLEGLTGLLQSPIKGAEKHGLPGVLSGIALGVTGLVARPAASILEVTGKTAQSIRNRSRLHHMGSQRFRVRLPRPLSREYPLRPYSWEEAIGTSVLAEADDGLKLRDETLVMCKALKQGGKFVIITERLVLIVRCTYLVDLCKPEFRGIPADPEWVIEAEIGMDSVIHADNDEEVVHIVGSSSDTLLRKNQNQSQQKRGSGTRVKRWNNSPTPLPLFQTDLELTCKEEAENLLQVLLSTIEKGKERGWGSVYLLHQSNLK